MAGAVVVVVGIFIVTVIIVVVFLVVIVLLVIVVVVILLVVFVAVVVVIGIGRLPAARLRQMKTNNETSATRPPSDEVGMPADFADATASPPACVMP